MKHSRCGVNSFKILKFEQQEYFLYICCCYIEYFLYICCQIKII